MSTAKEQGCELLVTEALASIDRFIAQSQSAQWETGPQCTSFHDQPLNSKQYDPNFWTPMTIEANGQAVLCNFGCDDEVPADAPLCIIPTQALDAVKDPVNTLEKPNVMTPWLDLLTAAGAKILLMHGRYFDKFSELAEDLRTASTTSRCGSGALTASSTT